MGDVTTRSRAERIRARTSPCGVQAPIRRPGPAGHARPMPRAPKQHSDRALGAVPAVCHTPAPSAPDPGLAARPSGMAGPPPASRDQFEAPGTSHVKDQGRPHARADHPAVPSRSAAPPLDVTPQVSIRDL
jgi:hypothetical protein